MIPLGDDNSLRKTVPVVTYILIILNVLTFLLELAGGEEFIKNWAFVPDRFLSHPISNIPTIFTSMFMHAGWGHLISNMLYLWIFGDNVEDRLGRLKFILFYLACGIIATFAQLMMIGHSDVPNLGASGAIAGVLGAYILFFPGGKVSVMVGRSVIQLPALIVIGFWFVLQFASQITSSTSATSDVGGVAYMAHVGGFITGVALAFALRSTERK